MRAPSNDDLRLAGLCIHIAYCGRIPQFHTLAGILDKVEYAKQMAIRSCLVYYAASTCRQKYKRNRMALVLACTHISHLLKL